MIMVMAQLQVGLAKNVEECMEFAAEGGKVVVSATPRGCSSQTHDVELPVALQALEVSCTAKIRLVLLHHGLRTPVKYHNPILVNNKCNFGNGTYLGTLDGHQAEHKLYISLSSSP